MKKTCLVIIIAAWLLIPTGTPDDIITWYLISVLGQQLYIILLVATLVLVWKYDITFDKMIKTLGGLFK